MSGGSNVKSRALRYYIIFACLAGAALLVLGAPEAWRRVTDKPWDGQQDWWVAHMWWQGTDPYSAASAELTHAKVGVLGHPPSTAFYALPLALIDLKLMARVLGAICVALLFAQLLLMARELKLPSPPATAFLMLGLIWVTQFFLYHLLIAQMSALLGFLYFLAWYWLRRDRDVPAGVAIGFACTLKLFPGALVLFLALGRRWRGVFAAGLTWLAVAAVMTSRFGLNSWREYFSGEKQIVDWWIGHASNVTLQGIVLRIIHPACVADSFADPVATYIASGISILLLGGIWLLCHRQLRNPARIDLPFALFALWSLISNAFYFEHYDVILVLPLGIVCVALWRAFRSGLSRVWVGASVVALGVAVWGTQVPPNNARIMLRIARTHPEWHLHAHLIEIGVALPMPLLMLVAAGLFGWFARRDFRGLTGESGRLALDEPTRLSPPAKPPGAQASETGTAPA